MIKPQHFPGLSQLRVALFSLGLLAANIWGCAGRELPDESGIQTGDRVAEPVAAGPRRGDEIVVNGKLFHTGAPVVLWFDPGGYSGYAGQDPRNPKSYGRRLDDSGRAVPDNLASLQKRVDQFVMHYDVAGTSRRCFATLKNRGLSVHFMLDIDGTIYQTIDVREKAFHATVSNERSVGIEIANIGAFPLGMPNRFSEWYRTGRDGQTYLVPPVAPGAPANDGVRTPGFVAKPYRNQIVKGMIQDQWLQQYDLTWQQYDSLVKLTAAICGVLPQVRCDYPRDASGKLIPGKLSDASLSRYQGLLGHYHIQANKSDPGPAFQWDMVVDYTRRRMAQQP